MGARVCGMCGHRNRIDALVCGSCASSLEGDPDKLTVTVDDIDDTGETPVPAPAAVAAMPPPSAPEPSAEFTPPAPSATAVLPTAAPPTFGAPVDPAGFDDDAEEQRAPTTLLLAGLLGAALATIALLVILLLARGGDDDAEGTAPVATTAAVSDKPPATEPAVTTPPATDPVDNAASDDEVAVQVVTEFVEDPEARATETPLSSSAGRSALAQVLGSLPVGTSFGAVTCASQAAAVQCALPSTGGTLVFTLGDDPDVEGDSTNPEVTNVVLEPEQ